MGFFESLPKNGPVKKGCGIQAVLVLLAGCGAALWALTETIRAAVG